jgi:hypothetical protein
MRIFIVNVEKQRDKFHKLEEQEEVMFWKRWEFVVN